VTALDRSVRFEGLTNFRDLGGLPAADGRTIRPGRLFRSDSLAYASDADARRLIDEFGVATVIDLRGEHEVTEFGRGPLGATAVGYVPVPITDVTGGDADLARHYVAILAERGEPLVGLLRRLTEPAALPAVLHCEAGCDRTGVVAAALLALLGVPDEVICADYALTADAVPAINARMRAHLSARGLPIPAGYYDNSWAPKAIVMAAVLDAVRDRWDGMQGWARTYGLTDAEQDRLRALLLD
jgi:protein-tyrosine phosphatase